jgi:hypothetical protein
MKNELTQERLKELLHYDPETGLFTRLKMAQGSPRKIGDVAGNLSQGYIRIGVDGVSYRAHRLVWLYMYGYWPTKSIDHINRIKDDNRFVNLREASRSQNAQNVGLKKTNTSGYKGISWETRRKKWVVQLRLNIKPIFLGYYDDIDEAIARYKEAQKIYHPFST